MLELQARSNMPILPSVEQYVNSDRFSLGLAAAQTVWSAPNAFRLSALYIYLNLMTIPEMMKIELDNSHRLKSTQGVIKDLMYTRFFLQNVVGLSEREELKGGIGNEGVVKQVSKIGLMHRKFPNMQDWMMNCLGYIITVAPIKVLPEDTFSQELRNQYFEYMRHAWLTMEVEIGEYVDGLPVNGSDNIQDVAERIDGLDYHVSLFRQSYTMMFGTDSAERLWEQVLASLHPVVCEIIRNSMLEA